MKVLGSYSSKEDRNVFHKDDFHALNYKSHVLPLSLAWYSGTPWFFTSILATGKICFPSSSEHTQDFMHKAVGTAEHQESGAEQLSQGQREALGFQAHELWYSLLLELLFGNSKYCIDFSCIILFHKHINVLALINKHSYLVTTCSVKCSSSVFRVNPGKSTSICSLGHSSSLRTSNLTSAIHTFCEEKETDCFQGSHLGWTIMWRCNTEHPAQTHAHRWQQRRSRASQDYKLRTSCEAFSCCFQGKK